MCHHQRTVTLLQRSTSSGCFCFRHNEEGCPQLIYLPASLLAAKSFNNVMPSPLCQLVKQGLSFTFNWQLLWNALNKECFIHSRENLIFRCGLIQREGHSQNSRESTPNKFELPRPGVTLPVPLLSGMKCAPVVRDIEKVGIHSNVKKPAGNA